MIRNSRCLVFAVSLLGLVVTAPLTSAMAGEAELIATLENKDAPLFDRTQACKQLAVIGTEDAVPVLAQLLSDEKLSHYARYALEPNPSRKVDEALIGALDKIQGRHLIGVINSIANRGKPTAIGALAKKMEAGDDQVVVAAAHAIARLGTPQAARVLGKVMTPQLAATGLVCGQTLARQGETEAALETLLMVGGVDGAPEHVRLAAMLQAVVLQQESGLDLLSTGLSADDKNVFNTALRAARLQDSENAVKAVLNSMPSAPPDHVARLVTLLGDLGEPAGLPIVANAVKSEDVDVRIAALAALANMGSAKQVQLVMDATADDVEEVSAQAIETLASLPGADVDQEVLELLDDSQRRALAIRIIGRRRIAEAVPKLVELIEGPHQLDVVAALGDTVSLDQMDVLVKMLDDDSVEVREAVQNAVHAASYRMPDRDATSQKLAGYQEGADAETLRFLMDELRQIGGSAALQIVTAAAKGNQDDARDAATAALGEWLDISAAPVLLELAQDEGTSKYGIRGLSGYVRLARQFEMPADQRMQICRTALDLAKRDREKRLVLAVLERYPTLEALEIVAEASLPDSLENAATATALLVADKIGRRKPEVREQLVKLNVKPVKIEIVKAEYGAGDKVKDVTDVIRQAKRIYSMIVLPSRGYSASFGGDPVRGTPKKLTITYELNGKAGEVTFKENEPIILPTPK